MATSNTPAPQADAVNIRFLMIDNYLIFRSFSPQTSMGEVKAMIASAWPADKKPSLPANAIRIVYCGQLLEDNVLLNQTRATAGAHWVTMHLWPRSLAPEKTPGSVTSCRLHFDRFVHSFMFSRTFCRIACFLSLVCVAAKKGEEKQAKTVAGGNGPAAGNSGGGFCCVLL